jgi:hypothetical protein
VARSHLKQADIMAELKILQRVHSEARRGYREVVRDLMGRASRIVIRLERHDDQKRKFLLRLSRTKANGGTLKKVQLSTEVMAVILKATTRSARKRAWKLGQVIDYLRAAGVHSDNTAQEIKRRGGIERIYRASVAAKRAGIASAKVPTVTSAGVVPPSENASNANTGRANNTDVLVPFYMKAADRDAITEIPNGTGIKLFALKIGQPKAQLKIRSFRIRKV